MPSIHGCVQVAALLVLSTGPAFAQSAVQPGPPVARVEAVTDTYFGEKITDPYRWMENDKDWDWLPFLRAQNDQARFVLDKLPGRESLLARIQQLSGEIAAPG